MKKTSAEPPLAQSIIGGHRTEVLNSSATTRYTELPQVTNGQTAAHGS